MNGRAAAVTCTRCAVHAESTFRVDGMDCNEEVTILERRLRPLGGLEDIVADVIGQRLHVKYDAALLSTTAISDAVAETGMRAWLEHEEPVLQPSSRSRGWLVQAAAASLAVGLAAQWLQWPIEVQIASFLTAAVTGGIYPGRKAVSALRRRTVDINVLMLVAVVGAIVLAQWAEAGTVVFLFAISQWLESRTMDRAREAIRALMDLTPNEALIKHDTAAATSCGSPGSAAHDHRVPVDRVEIGAIMIVRPGEKIPLDGRVQAGMSEVNQAPITGESLPVDKGPGDEVFAGTINGHGALDVEVTKRRRDTTLARIIHLVEVAQSQRAPVQQFIDRFARWYTPAVIAVAVLVAVIPPLAFGQSADDWLYRALVLLVVACPCALVISTPVSIVAALAGAARHGVLIKGGTHLEQLAKVRAMAFDKTGTLTKGQLHVSEIRVIGGPSAFADSASVDGSDSPGNAADDVLAWAAAIESRSEHPIAAAIHRAAGEKRLPSALAQNVRALPGLGVEGTVSGIPVICGSPRLFRERQMITPAVDETINAITAAGASAILVARGGEVIGAIAVADAVREVSADVVDLLRDLGIAPIVMLTGDQDATARAIAARVGVDDVRSELLPEDKVDALREIRETSGPIAMIGDGVNDAPALAAADVSIAMGAIGSDAALETADIALMSDELLKIPYAIRLSRATVRNIRTNIAISLTLKAAFLVLAVGGIATLWMAVIADTGASVIVIANALTLLKRT
jgi:Zn2+/Cd2+-exporting ATPase